MTPTQYREPRTRRAYLGTLATGAGLVLAGCTGDGSSADGEDGATTATGTDDGTATDGTDGTPTPLQAQPLPTPVAGDPSADVTLAVFEDYACPHCATYNVDGFPALSADYVEPGRIRYEHHDLPIPVADPGSWEAASAARAVQDRAGDDAFYDYAGRLFENHQQIRSDGPALYESVANDLELDGAAVREAAVNRVYDPTVRRDRQAGIDSDVSSTPTFILNGTIVAEGWAESVLSEVEAALDEALGGQTA
jgi:protein-disulfide isomerase